MTCIVVGTLVINTNLRLRGRWILAVHLQHKVGLSNVTERSAKVLYFLLVFAFTIEKLWLVSIQK